MGFDLYVPTREDAYGNLVPINNLGKTYIIQNCQFKIYYIVQLRRTLNSILDGCLT